MVSPSAPVIVDATMTLALNAEVVVTARETFKNLAELTNPAENLVGIAAAASEGAVTARQIESRPIMRAGEVLETVPGVIISQHSGEGKANQYYLRGFNLDHGTDFATTVAGIPVNMPTHGHGQGYSDLNFLIPELVTGVQFAEGSVLRAGRRFLSGRFGQRELRQRPRASDRERQRRRGRLGPAVARRVTARRRGHAARRRRAQRQRWPVGSRRTISASSTASCATAAATRRMRFR